jgi:Domian of unknown function (DUF4952)
MTRLVGKPTQLTFLSCQAIQGAQIRSLEARYQVTGKDAALVEAFLQQKFQMSPLRFVCCGWEPGKREQDSRLPRLGQYRDQQGYNYQITMHSGETLVTQRQDWAKIPFFYVKVTKFLEDP